MTWWGPLFQGENTRTCWGYTFNLTNDHRTPEELDPLKHTYDRLGEDSLTRLNEISPPPKNALPRTSDLPDEAASTKPPDLKPVVQRDLFQLLEKHHHDDPTLSKLWTEIQTVPSWVDWEQIARGQDVFYRYGAPALTGLTYQSLLGGMGAARVVETLARTGGFAPKVAKRRLYETTQHILQCTMSLDSIKPGGAGFKSSVRVRLLHAAVRQRIMKLREQRPDYYNVEKWGIPINDLDSMGTIATFSSTLIWVALPRQGIFLRDQEIKDYLALWRYIAYVMGVPTDVFATPPQAKAFIECLMLYEIDPSSVSQTMANNIIVCLQGQPPAFASAEMLTASARWLNGRDLSDRLGLADPGWYYSLLMAGQCLFFMWVCYGSRSVAYLDRRKIAKLKKVFYALIVDSKAGLAGTETTFEFKYVPEYETLTEMGRLEGPTKHTEIEARNLRVLLVAVGVLAVSLYGAVRITAAVVGPLMGMV